MPQDQKQNAIENGIWDKSDDCIMSPPLALKQSRSKYVKPL